MGITDPMVFELVRDAVETLLAENQSTFFRTIGEQKQSTDAEQVKGNLRTVQVFYSEGDYPRDSNNYIQVRHAITIQLLYTVSSPAKVDLSVLDDPEESAANKQAALLAASEGSRLADRLMDELRRMVSQIIMDPANIELGLDPYVVANRWLNNFRKSEPIDKGNLFILTGTETFTCIVDETFTGATTIEAEEPTADINSLQEPLSGEVLDANKPKAGVQTDQ